MSKYPREALTTVSPADLSWLTGKWQGQHGTEIIEEHWSGLNGRTLMAMFRWLKEGAVWFYELMVIEQEKDGRLFLRVKHFYPGLKGWEEKDDSAEFLLVQLEGQKAVFLQVNKPGSWLVYHRPAPNRLLAYFDNGQETVKEESKFNYQLQLD